MMNFANVLSSTASDEAVVDTTKTFLEKANEWITTNPFWAGVLIVGASLLVVGVLFANGVYKRKHR